MSSVTLNTSGTVILFLSNKKSFVYNLKHSHLTQRSTPRPMLQMAGSDFVFRKLKFTWLLKFPLTMWQLLSGDFTRCRDLRSSSGREYSRVTYSVRDDDHAQITIFCYIVLADHPIQSFTLYSWISHFIQFKGEGVLLCWGAVQTLYQVQPAYRFRRWALKQHQCLEKAPGKRLTALSNALTSALIRTGV